MMLAEWMWERPCFVPLCVFAAVGVLGSLGFWAAVRRSKNRLRRQFVDRPTLAKDEFCSRYYPSLQPWRDALGIMGTHPIK